MLPDRKLLFLVLQLILHSVFDGVRFANNLQLIRYRDSFCSL